MLRSTSIPLHRDYRLIETARKKLPPFSQIARSRGAGTVDIFGLDGIIRRQGKIAYLSQRKIPHRHEMAFATSASSKSLREKLDNDFERGGADAGVRSKVGTRRAGSVRRWKLPHGSEVTSRPCFYVIKFTGSPEGNEKRGPGKPGPLWQTSIRCGRQSCPGPAPSIDSTVCCLACGVSSSPPLSCLATSPRTS